MNANPRETQVPVGPLVAALGAVLLIVSLFLDWYEDITGFTVFEFNDLLLVGLALATLAALAAAMRLLRPISPGVGLAVAVLAFLVVLSQIVNDPPAVAGENGREQDVGIWLALGGAALMVAGAVLSTVRLAIAVEPRTRGAAPSASAPPPPPRDSEAPTVADEPPPPPRP
jgi:peptidoglycan/LPS O-acetylase OafA/YrhL